MIALQRIALAVALGASSPTFSAASFADEQPAETATDVAAPAETADLADKPECDKGISLSPEELVASLDAASDC